MKLAYDLLGIDIVEDLKEELLPLLSAEESVLTLDMQEVNKIDLSAIQLLISLQKSLLVQNKTLVLTNCAVGVQDALKLSGCKTLLGVCHE